MSLRQKWQTRETRVRPHEKLPRNNCPGTDPTICHAARDGECMWSLCPQNRDGEPDYSGRHCPLDYWPDERT